MNARPKNLALTLAAGLAIGAATITLFEGGVLILVFAVVGVSTVAGLVLAYILAPQRVPPLLKVLNSCLVSEASVVLRISIVLVGIVLMTIGVMSLVEG